MRVSSENKKIVWSLLIPFFLMGGIFLLFGFYYAWVDDIWLNLLCRGIVLPSPHGDLNTSQIFFSRIMAFLYTRMPKVPFYGIIHYLLLYISLVNISYIILGQISQPIKKVHLLIVFLFLLCFASELIMAYSFVQTTILLLFSACFGILYSRKDNKAPSFLLYFSCIMAASFLRSEANILCASWIGAFLFYFIISGRLRAKVKSLVLLILFLAIGSLSAYYYYDAIEDVYAQRGWLNSDYVLNACDYNYVSNEVPRDHRDSLVMRCMKSLVMADTNVLTRSAMEKVSPGSAITGFMRSGKSQLYNHTGKSLLGERLGYLIARSEKFKHGYFYTYNFGYLSLFYLLLSICLCLIFLRHQRSVVLTVVLLYWLGLFAIGLIYKMEFYVFKPMALFVFLFILLEYFNDPGASRIKTSFWVICLSLISLFGLARLTDLKTDLHKRDSDHALFQAKLDSLHERYIFVDIFSSGLLHGSPFNDLPIRSDNHELIIYPEHPLYFFTCFTQPFLGKAPSYTLLDFYDFILKHKTESVFLYSGREEFYSDILREYYHKTFTFTPDNIFYVSHGMTEPGEYRIMKFHASD